MRTTREFKVVPDAARAAAHRASRGVQVRQAVDLEPSVARRLIY